MGLYEYECPGGHVTEKLTSLEERPVTVRCKTCGQEATYVVSAVKTNFHAMDRKAIKRGGR